MKVFELLEYQMFNLDIYQTKIKSIIPLPKNKKSKNSYYMQVI